MNKPNLVVVSPTSQAIRATSARARSGSLAEHMAEQLPPFIVAGEWVDPFPNSTTAPRRHPYGLTAYVVIRGQRRLIFPSEAAAIAWEATQAPPTDAIDAEQIWWRGMAQRGDPSRRPNIAREAFLAGWQAARSAMRGDAKRCDDQF